MPRSVLLPLGSPLGGFNTVLIGKINPLKHGSKFCCILAAVLVRVETQAQFAESFLHHCTQGAIGNAQDPEVVTGVENLITFVKRRCHCCGAPFAAATAASGTISVGLLSVGIIDCRASCRVAGTAGAVMAASAATASVGV